MPTSLMSNSKQIYGLGAQSSLMIAFLQSQEGSDLRTQMTTFSKQLYSLLKYIAGVLSILASLKRELTKKKARPSSYAINEHFEQFIRNQVESGRFSNASEVVQAGLRLLEEQEMLRQKRLEELRQLIENGAQSGLGKPAGEVFNRLETRHRGIPGICPVVPKS